jgi:predicted metal-dependent hydrolase
VKLVGEYFVVTVPDGKSPRRVQTLMKEWYRGHAMALLTDRAKRVLESTTWLDIPMPKIKLRTLWQRWGSTTPRGYVYFNLDLVKLPLGCIDYVVAHELVHLKIPNHSPAYWRMLSRVMPDWKYWRERLERVEV